MNCTEGTAQDMVLSGPKVATVIPLSAASELPAFLQYLLSQAAGLPSLHA